MPDILNNDEFKRLLLSWPARAIQYLYTFHKHSLLKICEQRTRSREAAEDIVQDAFADLWERHPELGQKKDLAIAPYLTATVKNKSIDFNKQAARRNEYPLGEETTGMDESVLNADDIDSLWKLISALPAREKQCVVMKYFQHMSYGDMANELAVTIKAVERNLASARKRMKKYKAIFY